MTVDVTRLPTDATGWIEFVEWVIAGNAPDEPDWLEFKSEVSSRTGWAGVARFILGAANRLPEIAEAHLEGASVLLLGVDDQGAAVGTKGYDPADVYQGLDPFLGHDSPRWQVHDVVVASGTSTVTVTVLEVQPPEGGHIFLCHGNSEGVRSGAVYVRHPGQTKEATYEEMRERLGRLGSSQASLVSAWLESSPLGDIAVIANESSLPIHDVVVSYGAAYGAGEPYLVGAANNICVLKVPPGRYGTVPPASPGGAMGVKPDLAISFRDHRGACWRRDVRGRLERLATGLDTFSANEIEQPVPQWSQIAPIAAR